MKIKILSSVVALVAIVACSSKIKYEGIDSSSFKNITSTRVVMNDSYEFAESGDLLLEDSLVVVVDRKDGKCLSFFNRRDFRHMGSGVGVGRGASEVLNPLSFNMKNDTIIEVLDWGMGRVVRYAVSDILVGDDGFVGEFTIDKDVVFPIALKSIGDKYVCKGRSRNHLAILDNEGAFLSVYDKYPDMGIDDEEAVWSINNQTTNIVVNEKLKRFALATTIGMTLQVFSYDNNKIELLDIKYLYEPKYRNAGGTPSWFAATGDCVVGAVSVNAAGGDIYMIYSDITSDQMGDAVGLETKIAVYDWDLNLKGGYVFNDAPYSMTIDENGECLYVVEESLVDGKTSIVRYNL